MAKKEDSSDVKAVYVYCSINCHNPKIVLFIKTNEKSQNAIRKNLYFRADFDNIIRLLLQ